MGRGAGELVLFGGAVVKAEAEAPAASDAPPENRSASAEMPHCLPPRLPYRRPLTIALNLLWRFWTPT